MATFFVFSSRHVLGHRFADMLGVLLPGFRSTPWDWPELAESLAAVVEHQADAFVVYREDLNDARSVKEALQHDFGAEAGDLVIEVDTGLGLHMFADRFAEKPRIAA